jgi:hypothetical protein
MAASADPLARFYRHRDYVHCRTFGHAWEEIPVTEPHPDGHSFWLRCVHCTMTRKDVFDRYYGELLHRQYEQPIDYSLAGEEVPTRAEFRLKLFDLAQSLADRREARKTKSA